MREYLLPVMGYLLGSVPMAIVVTRAMGLTDPRTIGSHNPGATNVLRYGGKLAALLTLAGDAAKGVVAVLVACALSDDPRVIALTAVMVFAGHIYPIFFRFQGGKGVATAAGVWFAIAPLVGLALVATWLVVAAIFRYSSLAALVAAILAPVYVWFFAPAMAYVAASIAISVLLIWRHRSNIRHLRAGMEGRIGVKRGR